MIRAASTRFCVSEQSAQRRRRDVPVDPDLTAAHPRTRRSARARLRPPADGARRLDERIEELVEKYVCYPPPTEDGTSDGGVVERVSYMGNYKTGYTTTGLAPSPRKFRPGLDARCAVRRSGDPPPFISARRRARLAGVNHARALGAACAVIGVSLYTSGTGGSPDVSFAFNDVDLVGSARRYLDPETSGFSADVIDMLVAVEVVPPGRCATTRAAPISPPRGALRSPTTSTARASSCTQRFSSACSPSARRASARTLTRRSARSGSCCPTASNRPRRRRFRRRRPIPRPR